MNFYVSVEKNDDGQAVLKVDGGLMDVHTFPLTKSGCMEAGELMSQRGAMGWMNSSSVDFPTEVAPRFRGNVQEWLEDGWERSEKKKKAAIKVFWFHYNKPESKRQGKNILTVHQSKTCHLVTDIKCEVPIETRHRKDQPRCVLAGKGVVRVENGMATIRAE